MESDRSSDKEQKLVVIDGFSAESLRDILKLERECFPASWQYPEAGDYYAAMLDDRENVNIFLRESGETVGYALVKPFRNAVPDLKEFDPELLEESDKFYIETIQILPAYRGRGGAKALLIGACEAVLKRGVDKFAIHARTVNGLHEIIKRIFKGSIISSRNIEKWEWAQGEPYEYIEWIYVPRI